MNVRCTGLLAALLVSLLGPLAAPAQDQKPDEDVAALKKEIEKLRDVQAALKEQLAQALQEAKVEAARSNEIRAVLEKQAAELAAQRARIEAELAAQRAKVDAELRRTQAETIKALEDAKVVAARLAESAAQVTQLQAERELLKTSLIRAEILLKVFEARNEELQKRIQELEKRGANPRERPAPGAVNPPAESVEGLIKQVAKDANLVTINLGADAGLQKGQTLEVFRLGMKPMYLGTVRIVETQPKEAVAQFVGKPTAAPEVGDRVASKLKP